MSADEPTLHRLDKDLAAHVAGCAEQSRQMWHELRSLKRVVWIANGMVIGTLLAVIGVLAKAQFHL